MDTDDQNLNTQTEDADSHCPHLFLSYYFETFFEITSETGMEYNLRFLFVFLVVYWKTDFYGPAPGKTR
jgi:hypothetical protein